MASYLLFPFYCFTSNVCYALLQLEAAQEREKELLHEITDLQWRYCIVNIVGLRAELSIYLKP